LRQKLEVRDTELAELSDVKAIKAENEALKKELADLKAATNEPDAENKEINALRAKIEAQTGEKIIGNPSAAELRKQLKELAKAK